MTRRIHLIVKHTLDADHLVVEGVEDEVTANVDRAVAFPDCIALFALLCRLRQLRDQGVQPA